MLNVIVASILFVFLSSVCGRFYVDPIGGVDVNSTRCSDANNPCRSITYALQFYGSNSYEELMLMNDIITEQQAADNCNFWKTVPLRVIGNRTLSGGMVSVNCHDTTSQVYFLDFVNLSIQNLTISTSQSSTIQFLDCISFNLSITIVYSGQVVLNNCTVFNKFHIDPFTNVEIRNSRLDSTNVELVAASDSRINIVLHMSGVEVINSEISIRQDLLMIRKMDHFFLFEDSTFYNTNLQLIGLKNVTLVNTIHRGNFPLPSIFSNEQALNMKSTNYPSYLKIQSTIFTDMDRGAVHLSGPIISSIVSSNFVNNKRANGGAALYLQQVSNTEITGCKFLNNQQTDSTLSISNGGGGGGAIFNFAGSLYLNKNVFYNNSAKLCGGSMLVMNSPNVFMDLEIHTYNTGQYGGAIYMENSLFVESGVISTLRYNKATVGGSVYLSNLELAFFTKFLNWIEFSSAEVMGGGAFFKNVQITYFDNFSLDKQKVLTEYINNNTVLSSHVGTSNIGYYPTSIQLVKNDTQEAVYFGEKTTFILELRDLNDQLVPFDERIANLTGLDGSIYAKIQYIGVEQMKTKFEISFLSRTEILPSNVSFSKIQLGFAGQTTDLNVPVTIKACPPLYEMRSVQSGKDAGYFACQFKDGYLALFIILGSLLVFGVIGMVIFIVARKMIEMRKKVKKLDEKELAERQLNEKLLDLQSLYSTTVAAQHVFKKWMIPVEEIKLIRKIGEGGFGVVYLGLWKGTEVALKTVKINEDEIESEEFEHEASLLSSLRFPNIVTFWGVSMTDTSKFIITEFLSGGSLDKLIYECKSKRKILTLYQKMKILSDIANGMDYLHEREPKVLHRDLKPANVLLTNEMTAKVCDFGVSKLVSPEANTQTQSVGTILYFYYCVIVVFTRNMLRSPEILLGESYDERSDVYSFSIIMWQLIFEETGIFNSCYSHDPKFSSFMSEETLQKFSKINPESVMGVPKLILDGIRPPIPTLPLQLNNSKHVKWVQTFINPNDDLFYNSTDLGTCLEVLNRLFTLIEKCWQSDMNLRPSFSFILSELTQLLYLEQKQH